MAERESLEAPNIEVAGSNPTRRKRFTPSIYIVAFSDLFVF